MRFDLLFWLQDFRGYLNCFFCGQRLDDNILLLFRGLFGSILFNNSGRFDSGLRFGSRFWLNRAIGCKGYGDDMRLFGWFFIKGYGNKPEKESMKGQGKQGCE